MPLLDCLPLPAPSKPSAGRVELWSASSLQLPASSKTICTPPPLLIFLVAPPGRGAGGNGRWKDGAGGIGGGGGEGEARVEGEGGG